MKYVFLLVIVVFFYKCGIKKDDDKKDSANDLEMEIVEFLKTNQFKKVSLKSDIPNYIFEIIKQSYDSNFTIADKSESDKVSFSDAKLTGSQLEDYKYNKLIKFVLFNKDNFIMVYRKGGLGSQDVIIYFCEKNQDEFLLYESPKMINTLNDLIVFLESGNSKGDKVKR